MAALAQNLVVALIVAGCVVYAVWTLLPAAARRGLASGALRLPLPSALAESLRRAARPAGTGCGCDGCDRADIKPAAAAPQRVTFHPRPPR